MGYWAWGCACYCVGYCQGKGHLGLSHSIFKTRPAVMRARAGVVFADAESESAAALRNAVKLEKLEDPGGWAVG